MAPKQQNVTNYSTPQGLSIPNPKTIIANRNPATTDRGYQLGTLWVNKSASSSYQLVSVSAGSATWSALGGGATQISTLTGNSGGAISPVAGNINLSGGALNTFVGSGNTLTLTPKASAYPITPFVVGPVGQAGYQTIQSALTAANAAGGGMVYVQPGTYTENLTFTGNITLIGSSEQDVFIIGTHVPPTTGFLNLFRCTFQGAAAIFSSAAAGTAAIIMEDCSVNVTNGWAFDLLNWASPGSVAVDDIGPFGTTDGFFRNTGGAGFFAFSAGIGNGTTNALTVSGLTVIFGADITCPLTLQTGAILAFDNGFCAGAITFSNNSTGAINNCRLTGGASAAVTMSSSASVSILNSVISSSNNPAIAGAGAGTLTLGGNTYPLNALHAATLTVAYASREGVLATKNTAGASPQIVNARSGQVAFTDTIANGAYGTLTLTNSTILATSVIVASVSCTTVNSACQIVETTPGAGSVAFRIFNAGAATTAANILVNFWVIN